jgi:hypothetical protein
MSTPANSPLILRFEIFEVDLRAGELYKAGRKIKLVLPFRSCPVAGASGRNRPAEELQKKALVRGYFCGLRSQPQHGNQEATPGSGDNNKKPRFVETFRSAVPVHRHR